MPVIRFGGNGLNNNTTSQQVSAPTTKDNQSVVLDNTLQLDQKVRNLQGISQNIVDDGSKINKRGKNYLLTNKTYQLDRITETEGTSPVVLQGSNYPVVSPKQDTILINNSPSFIIFENIEFYSDKKPAIIKLQNNSKVLFKNCIFRKEANIQDASGNFVEMENGCKASFVGCLFTGTQALGNVVENFGIANNATINGGFNKTGIFHSNTTIFGELT